MKIMIPVWEENESVGRNRKENTELLRSSTILIIPTSLLVRSSAQMGVDCMVAA